MQRGVVMRSAKVSLLVGTLLALINHGDKLLGPGLAMVDAEKIALTYLVPYAVATWSAVQTVLAGNTASE
jgi:hypothetical protein